MILRFQHIGGRAGDPYPPWVRALKGRSGVYVIRTGETVAYVGESHAGRLYETLTRHFQAWRRRRGGYTEWDRHTGHTYSRVRASVAVVITSPRQAPKLQFQLIDRLRPRDNQIAGDTVPF